MIGYEQLLKKGFSKQEAMKTIGILAKAEQKKSARIRFLDSIIYWVLLFVAIIGNMVIAIILIPFILTFRPVPLFFIIALLAAMFGFLMDTLIRDIESIEKKHLIIAWLLIPSLAVINIFYMTSFTDHLVDVFSMSLTMPSPFFISFVYVMAFTLPYIFHDQLQVFYKRMSG